MKSFSTVAVLVALAFPACGRSVDLGGSNDTNNGGSSGEGGELDGQGGSLTGGAGGALNGQGGSPTGGTGGALNGQGGSSTGGTIPIGGTNAVAGNGGAAGSTFAPAGAGSGGTPIGGAGGCTPFGFAGSGGGGDPTPQALYCSEVSKYLAASVTTDGDDIVLNLWWCGSCSSGGICFQYGQASGLGVAVQGSWAVIAQQGSETTCRGNPVSDFLRGDYTVRLVPENGTARGDVVVTGTFAGSDTCSRPVTCPVNVRFAIDRDSATQVEVLENDPSCPLETNNGDIPPLDCVPGQPKGCYYGTNGCLCTERFNYLYECGCVDEDSSCSSAPDPSCSVGRPPATRNGTTMRYCSCSDTGGFQCTTLGLTNN